MPIVPAANGDAQQVDARTEPSVFRSVFVPGGNFCLSHQAEAPAGVAPPAVEEKPKEDWEEFEDISAMLEHLGLSEYKNTFEEEKIDIESFVRIKAPLNCHKVKTGNPREKILKIRMWSE